ncbi:hypothetical protein KW797_02345 [Candidatus Parcubacteria bacterium]|nr:hypothetical protein [Candidatus Parcubacteria bacterium]
MNVQQEADDLWNLMIAAVSHLKGDEAKRLIHERVAKIHDEAMRENPECPGCNNGARMRPLEKEEKGVPCWTRCEAGFGVHPDTTQHIEGFGWICENKHRLVARPSMTCPCGWFGPHRAAEARETPSRGPCGQRWHVHDCDCGGDGGDR